MKEVLESYAEHRQLLEAYREELANGPEVWDTVTGSMEEAPYAQHVIAIRGRDLVRERWLAQRTAVLEAACAEAEAYVEGVADEHMRELLRRHYLRGESWETVRRNLRMRHVTHDCLRKRAHAYLGRGFQRGAAPLA